MLRPYAMKINCADHHLLFRAMLIPTTLLIIYYVADTVLAFVFFALPPMFRIHKEGIMNLILQMKRLKSQVVKERFTFTQHLCGRTEFEMRSMSKTYTLPANYFLLCVHYLGEFWAIPG